MQKHRVIGIDAAFSNVGLAVADVTTSATGEILKVEVLDLRLIHTEAVKKRPKGVPRSSDDLRRAREAVTGIHEYIALWRPDRVVAEVPFGSQSARASWALGIAVGVLASIPNLIEVTPGQVKAATGEKHADKDEMIAWGIETYPDAPWAMRKLKGALVQVASTNEHLADALAAIHAGTQTKQYRDAGLV